MQHPFVSWAEDPAFRDQSDYHARRTQISDIDADLDADWQRHNEQLELAYGVPLPPLWAYHPHGRLRETPFLPFQTGYQQPTHLPAIITIQQ